MLHLPHQAQRLVEPALGVFKVQVRELAAGLPADGARLNAVADCASLSISNVLASVSFFFFVFLTPCPDGNTAS